MTTRSAVISTVALPRTRLVTAALVVGFALLTALMAQIKIPLWFTPVPITGQTFSVLLAGAALGSRAGAGSQALYWAVGALGLPFFAGSSGDPGMFQCGCWPGQGGWEVATGVTAGYLVGFVVAAYLVGLLAERQQDRTVLTAIPAFLLGSAVIYLFGVTWLMVDLGVSGTEALELGMTPFVIGDLVKIALAGLLLPTAWRFLGDGAPS